MGLFGKSKKEREKEYMNRLDVPLCLKEDFELIIDDVFTIMGVGTVATGNISTGMCREGENACVYKTNGGVLETIITNIDIHTKERKSNVYSLNAKLHSFRVLPPWTFAVKMLQIAVVQFSKRPRRANSEKQKNAAKSAKKDFCYNI